MSGKVKNTIILFIILLIIGIGGAVYTYVLQKGKIDEREKKIEDLMMYQMDTEALIEQLTVLKKRVVELDSILALRKYNIPQNLSQSSFYDFVNKVTFSFSPNSFVNIEYDRLDNLTDFSYYVFRLSGTAEFNDIYKLIYAIEQSKELKKIIDASMNNFVKVDDDRTPHYLVTFNLTAAIYFSVHDRFASAEFVENRLIPNPVYDIFYPLIRNEIPPNTDNLLDVQDASLLALIPDGAFLADPEGNTFLLWEGDRVYLGYLTEIDYEKNSVEFILNKGGIIEKISLTLENSTEK
ncbi:MAG: hypothetical protein KKA84_01545 [Bacteroidetes bacterium]|nr:hypothetical protein [Bacteroidota bacterium]